MDTLPQPYHKRRQRQTATSRWMMVKIYCIQYCLPFTVSNSFRECGTFCYKTHLSIANAVFRRFCNHHCPLIGISYNTSNPIGSSNAAAILFSARLLADGGEILRKSLRTVEIDGWISQADSGKYVYVTELIPKRRYGSVRVSDSTGIKSGSGVKNKENLLLSVNWDG